MILTLSSPTGTHHIEINADQFAKLRHPEVSLEEINIIAAKCEVDSALLIQYAEDLKKFIRETIEIDGSCDYSDHF